MEVNAKLISHATPSFQTWLTEKSDNRCPWFIFNGF